MLRKAFENEESVDPDASVTVNVCVPPTGGGQVPTTLSLVIDKAGFRKPPRPVSGTAYHCSTGLGAAHEGRIKSFSTTSDAADSSTVKTAVPEFAVPFAVWLKCPCQPTTRS